MRFCLLCRVGSPQKFETAFLAASLDKDDIGVIRVGGLVGQLGQLGIQLFLRIRPDPPPHAISRGEGKEREWRGKEKKGKVEGGVIST